MVGWPPTPPIKGINLQLTYKIMSKCIKDYRRHSCTYLAGKEYDIDKETILADEAYCDEPLWEKSKAKSEPKSEGIISKVKKVAKKGKK